MPPDLLHSAAIQGLAKTSGHRILFIVLDGLGGFASRDHDSELTTAHTPNLDRLAYSAATGLLDPVRRGITSGSAPGHLGLFGYDPLEYAVGRGVFTAAAVGVDLKEGELAARANFCTLGADRTILDRRAGRLSTIASARLCQLVQDRVQLDNGASFRLVPEAGHRLLFTLRSSQPLDASVSDTDPQCLHVQPYMPTGLASTATTTAALVAEFLQKAEVALAGEVGNFILMRGFDTAKSFPQFEQLFEMTAKAIAVYPMYLGIGKMIGMSTEAIGDISDAAAVLEQDVDTDFTFLHYADPDLAGEDADHRGKVRAIERFDYVLPDLINADPNRVVVICGDHSTPAQLGTHSWHPVPVLIAGGSAPHDRGTTFDERSCLTGSLGRFPAFELMPQVLAVANRLRKYDGLLR